MQGAVASGFPAGTTFPDSIQLTRAPMLRHDSTAQRTGKCKSGTGFASRHPKEITTRFNLKPDRANQAMK
jgi:hypothetical protein